VLSAYPVQAVPQITLREGDGLPSRLVTLPEAWGNPPALDTSGTGSAGRGKTVTRRAHPQINASISRPYAGPAHEQAVEAANPESMVVRRREATGLPSSTRRASFEVALARSSREIRSLALQSRAQGPSKNSALESQATKSATSKRASEEKRCLARFGLVCSFRSPYGCGGRRSSSHSVWYVPSLSTRW
jgi:hypothetical protein